ncbi:hypothetical protein K7X08_024347 [Anisodus acutangulus]|uniref:Uncharacterized protein n=1 Tax=Anisodus acutangulus TaxID=402998 RepID=A0A9Q1M7P8_9SOLA|nr:hypothetical protein K7X08_024347 [Anisodus acutangulus]
MERALRESLKAVHFRKLQNTPPLHLLMSSEQDGQTPPWHPANKSQYMPFPEVLPQKIWDTSEIHPLQNLLMFWTLEKLIEQDRPQLQY